VRGERDETIIGLTTHSTLDHYVAKYRVTRDDYRHEIVLRNMPRVGLRPSLSSSWGLSGGRRILRVGSTRIALLWWMTRGFPTILPRRGLRAKTVMDRVWRRRGG